MKTLGTIVYLKEGILFFYDCVGCVYPIGMNPE